MIDATLVLLIPSFVIFAVAPGAKTNWRAKRLQVL